MGPRKSKGKGGKKGARKRDLERSAEHKRKLEAEAALGKGAGNDRTEWLEDRVKVLERIVTDKGTNLAAEIEALRDSSDVLRSRPEPPRLPERRDEA